MYSTPCDLDTLKPIKVCLFDDVCQSTSLYTVGMNCEKTTCLKNYAEICSKLITLIHAELDNINRG
jgi:hypothetical protein